MAKHRLGARRHRRRGHRRPRHRHENRRLRPRHRHGRHRLRALHRRGRHGPLARRARRSPPVPPAPRARARSVFASVPPPPGAAAAGRTGPRALLRPPLLLFLHFGLLYLQVLVHQPLLLFDVGLLLLLGFLERLLVLFILTLGPVVRPLLVRVL